MTIELTSAGNPSLRLLLLAEPFDADGYGSFTVTIDSPELSLRHSVITMGGDGLSEFIQSVEDDWRGWEGERSWHSLEGGLRIDAKHSGRAVELTVVVRSSYEPDAWELRIPFAVEPGEQLSALATAAASMIRS